MITKITPSPRIPTADCRLLETFAPFCDGDQPNGMVVVIPAASLDFRRY